MANTKKIQIKDLRPGMKIKTLDSSQNVVYREVTDKWDTTVNCNDQVRLQFENGVVVNCSVNHPIMVWTENGFEQIMPTKLTDKHKVLTDQGFTRLLVADLNQSNDTNYVDITVEGEHTFFVSDKENGPMILTHNSQGGLRNASATTFFQIWHYQFEDLIVLKNNQGTEETRVRHMDYGVVISAFFLRRFKRKENITFFDPSDVPDLYDAFYTDSTKFEELYVKYEKRKDIRKKTMSAEEVFHGGVFKERTDTGRIYIVNIDNVQKQGPFDPKHHPIYQSNLCCVTGDSNIDICYKGNYSTLSIEEFVEKWMLGYYEHDIQVKSWDDGVKWEHIMNAALTKEVDELYEIHDDISNKTLRCTADHKIFTTNRGWVEAQDLIETDTIVID